MTDFSHLIQKIKHQINIADMLGRDIKLSRRGHRVIGLCPFHNEKTPSFHIDASKGQYHCFGCGRHGDHLSYLTEKKSMSFGEALRTLAEQAGYIPELEALLSNREPTSIAARNTASSFKSEYETLYAQATQWFQQCLSKPKADHARTYLAQRDIETSMIEAFHLGYAHKDYSLKQHLQSHGWSLDKLERYGLTQKGRDTFHDRIIFPIYNRHNAVIAFGGRTVEKDIQPKYLNSAETPFFKKREVLYGVTMSYPHITHTQAPLVVEGYTDVIGLHQHGIKTAVAPLGTALTEEHIRILWRRHRCPLFCFDGDNAGLSAGYRVIEKLIPMLKPEYSALFVFLPIGHDPDSYVRSMGAPAFTSLVQTAVPLHQAIWQLAKHTHAITPDASPEAKTLLKKNLLALLQNISDTDLRQFYIKDLNDRLYNFFRPTTPDKRLGKPFSSVRLQITPEKINKFLLAYLIHHPHLIGDVSEMLIQLYPLTHHLSSLRNCMCEWACTRKGELEQVISSKGLDETVITLNKELEAMPFNHLLHHNDASRLQLWTDVWNHHYNRRDAQTEVDLFKAQLHDDSNEVLWQKWQKLKTQLV